MEPLEKRVVSVAKADKIAVTVMREDPSSFEKSLFNKRYKLTVESRYTFLVTEKPELFLTLLRETVRITGSAYYERIILKEKPEQCIDEYYRVRDLRDIKKLYNKKDFFRRVFVSPFEDMTGLCIIAFVLSLVLAFKIGILFSVLLFLCLYGLISALDMLVAKSSDSFFGKIFGIRNDRAEFEKILSEQYINDFYKSDLSDAYLNEIHIDETAEYKTDPPNM